MPLIAEAAVSNTAYSFDMLFSYSVPEQMSSAVRCGCRILVPFGRNNAKRIAVVMKLSDGDGKGLKAIAGVIDDEPVISDELLGLALYLRENTFCTYFEAVKVMLPPGMSVSVKEKFRINPEFTENELLSSEANELFDILKESSDESELQSNAEAASENGSRRLISELCDKGALISDSIFRRAVGDASVKMVRLTDEYINSPDSFRLTPKQKKTADFLMECGCASVREVTYMCGVTAAVVKRLTVCGAAEEYDSEIFRRVEMTEDEKRSPDEIILSDEQQNAHDSVLSQIVRREPAVFLLHGVTGSGKTSVFEKLIADTVDMGRQALLLIPEIGLTPQILKRFRSLFGSEVAVIHSGLSLGQRLDEYKRIKRGLAHIVIGTRSAVFAPLDNIGLIIMDEEESVHISPTAHPDTQQAILPSRDVLFMVQCFCWRLRHLRLKADISLKKDFTDFLK